jgi:hypothetical protein
VSLRDEEFREEFETQGYLAPAVEKLAAIVRKQLPDWFDFADELSSTLQRMIFRTSTAAAVDQKSFEPKPVAHAVLLRGVGNFQGAILMAERGMVIQARTLARSVLEDAFCMAALHDKPEVFLEHLRNDHNLARKSQAKAILKLVDPEKYDAAALKHVISEIPRLKNLGVDGLAELGALASQYVAYKVLSNDGAHPSAKSLERHMSFSEDRKGWNGFRVGPGKNPDIAEALNFALLAALPLGIGYTQILGDDEGNTALRPLVDRYHGLPDMRTL